MMKRTDVSGVQLLHCPRHYLLWITPQHLMSPDEGYTIHTWYGDSNQQIVPSEMKGLRVYLPLCKVTDTPFHIQGE